MQMPNCRFNADANTGHGFAMFMACVGALRLQLRRRLTLLQGLPHLSSKSIPHQLPLAIDL